MKAYTCNKGQALLELAVFGSLILVVFGMLLSYMNRLNDQQYIQMETFRRALQIGNNGDIFTHKAGGGSVSLTQMENSRAPDLSGYFRKGSGSSSSASASILWTVPEVSESGESLTYYKINDDYSTNLKDKESVDEIRTSQDTDFNESMRKVEDTTKITNIRTSTLKDSITTRLLDEDGNEIWSVTQGAYKDVSGKIKYGQAAAGGEVTRSRTWITEGFE
jgi:hypothetical protein